VQKILYSHHRVIFAENLICPPTSAQFLCSKC
jgi:hypothetical protein